MINVIADFQYHEPSDDANTNFEILNLDQNISNYLNH